jgi:hypothetical protein
MIYINALELINACVKNDILVEEKGYVFVLRKGKKGWCPTDKDLLAKELMKDEKGQKRLISALKEKNVEFTPKDYSWLNKEKEIFEETLDELDEEIDK